MKIALTGHRPQRLGLPDDETNDKWQQISDWILHQLIEANKLSVIKDESLDLYCGMASGCDMVFGFVSTLCKLAPKAKLHCILPCKDYNSSHQYYEILKENADEWVELSEEFYKGCDNVRDQYMVDHCDTLLAIWDGNKSGGVWSTIRKAQKTGLDIIYYPNENLTNRQQYSSITEMLMSRKI